MGNYFFSSSTMEKTIMKHLLFLPILLSICMPTIILASDDIDEFDAFCARITSPCKSTPCTQITPRKRRYNGVPQSPELMNLKTRRDNIFSIDDEKNVETMLTILIEVEPIASRLRSQSIDCPLEAPFEITRTKQYKIVPKTTKKAVQLKYNLRSTLSVHKKTASTKCRKTQAEKQARQHNYYLQRKSNNPTLDPILEALLSAAQNTPEYQALKQARQDAHDTYRKECNENNFVFSLRAYHGAEHKICSDFLKKYNTTKQYKKYNEYRKNRPCS